MNRSIQLKISLENKNMKLIFCALLLSVSLFAQSEEPKDTNTIPPQDAPKQENKKWYLYLQGSRGNSNLHILQGTISSGKIGVEYRLTPYIGLGFGINGNNSTFTEKPRAIDVLQVLLYSGYIVNSGTITTLLPIINNLQPRTFNINYTTASADFNFHFNGDRRFDPYIGMGLFGGTCSGGGRCNVGGGEVKLGLQINFETFYIFGQGQYQSLVLAYINSSANMINAMGSIGVGARF
jgi:hypothetical protein